MPQPLKNYLNGHTEEELQKRHEGRCIEASSECLCYVDGYTDGTKDTLAMVMREIEELSVFQGETDFEDGGDSEYADRRMAVDAARTNGQHEMKQSILSTLKQKLSGNGE